MKVACDQCDKIAEEPLAGWLELDWAGLDLSTFGQKRLPVRFCSGDCCITWLSSGNIHRGHQANINPMRS